MNIEEEGFFIEIVDKLSMSNEIDGVFLVKLFHGIIFL